MRVTVQYLGMLKEFAGCESATVEAPDGTALGGLFDELQQRIPQLSQFRGAIAMAVNYEYSGRDRALQDGDEVALIPPVSGGTLEEASSGATPPIQTTEHAALVRQPIDGAAILAAVLADANGFALVGDPARIHLDEKSAMLRLAPSRHVRSHGGRERLALDLNRSQFRATAAR